MLLTSAVETALLNNIRSNHQILSMGIGVIIFLFMLINRILDLYLIWNPVTRNLLLLINMFLNVLQLLAAALKHKFTLHDIII